MHFHSTADNAYGSMCPNCGTMTFRAIACVPGELVTCELCNKAYHVREIVSCASTELMMVQSCSH